MNSPLSDVAEKIAKSRYYLKDNDGNIIEDWEKLSWRVTNYVCRDESEEFKKEVFDLIYNTKFLPNTPCLVNAGKTTKANGLSACFVVTAPEDNWKSIMKTVEEFGNVARKGGGAGVSLSKIRPEGAPVMGSSHAKACGPIEVMRIISEAMSSITQSGIRGMACLASLHVSHPDIINFIKCKQRDRALKTFLKEDIFGHYNQIKEKTHDQLNIVLDKFISNFNISVMANDKFMEAVEKDADWNLEFDGKVYNTIKARDLFNMIAENAWQNGDPGFLFEDAINDGPYKYSGQWINATNPCVAAGSLVATEKGWVAVEDVEEGDLIWSRNSLYPVKTKEVNHNCDLYRVEFSDGDYIDVTAAHRFKCVISKRYEYRRLDEISEGSKVLVESVPLCKMAKRSIFENVSLADLDLLSEEQNINYCLFSDDSILRRDLGLIIGSVIGDGCFTEKINRYNVKVAFGYSETEWQNRFKSILDKYNIKNSVEEGDSSNRVGSNALGHLLETIGINRSKAPNKVIPQSIMQSNDIPLLTGILDGLFSTDGSMYLKKDNPMLRLSNSSQELCKQVRRILLGFGVHARIYRSDRKTHIYQDPKYGAREISTENPRYDLVIMNDGINKFHQQITLSNPAKEAKIKECVKTYHYHGPSWTTTIRAITKLEGKHTVYDLYNESTDEWNVNGYIQQGCGEQPLPPGIPEKGGGGGVCNLGSIDISKFYQTSTKSIDWDSLRNTIRTAIQFLDNVVETNSYPTPAFKAWALENRPIGLGIMGLADLFLKMKISYGGQKSLEVAEEIASFLETESHKKSVELAKQRGTPKCCQFDELEHRRNITLTSIAPTGSISLLAGCSSSIEPIFSPTIYRYDNTGSSILQHEDAEKSYFRCALDKDRNGEREVHWKEHIAMQAAFQKYGSSGISKTCNLPNSATVEDIKKAYLFAWKQKCKGTTVYRDGCKTTQVLNTNQKVDIGFNRVEDRPEELPCDIFATTAEGFEWHLIVGKLENRPYEIFAVNGRVELPESGKVVKVKKRHYALLNDAGETLIENLAEEESSIHPKISLETRRFSLELRHGISPKHIVEQIDKSSDVVNSFSKAAGRVLKKNYLSEEDVKSIATDIMCPDCAKNGKEVEMVSDSGCWKCPSCHWAKCG